MIDLTSDVETNLAWKEVELERSNSSTSNDASQLAHFADLPDSFVDSSPVAAAVECVEKRNGFAAANDVAEAIASAEICNVDEDSCCNTAFPQLRQQQLAVVPQSSPPRDSSPLDSKKVVEHRLRSQLEMISRELGHINARKEILERKQRAVERQLRTLRSRPSSRGAGERPFCFNGKHKTSSNKKGEQMTDCIAEKPTALCVIELSTTQFPWSDRVEAAKVQFGIREFRRSQLEVINCLMKGEDCFVVMPTGAGKSLCYQIPSLLKEGITIVVSPLLALMQDQLAGLEKAGVPATSISGMRSKKENTFVYEQMIDPKSDIKLIYVTPELVIKNKFFVRRLHMLHDAGSLALIVIDEAHCCSQWGHDFRPQYSKLGFLKDAFKRVPLVALTATATTQVMEDVENILNIVGCVKFALSFNRPNLFYEIRRKPTNRRDLLTIIACEMKQRLGQAGIVYTLSRKDAERISDGLSKQGISCEYYHGELDAQSRETRHHRWLNNSTQVIVATIAFGLGINKPDVRYVIHTTMSKSIENYYQETGRAGRDGRRAYCLLLYSSGDIPKLSSMLFEPQNQNALRNLRNLYSMALFCLNLRKCRREILASHFGGDSVTAQDCAGFCDVCRVSGSNAKTLHVDGYAHSLLCTLRDRLKSGARCTLIQLADIWLKSNGSHSRIGNRNLQKEDAQDIVAMMIIEEVLEEKPVSCSYSTPCYVEPGPNANRLLAGELVISLDFPNSCATTVQQVESDNHTSSKTRGPEKRSTQRNVEGSMTSSSWPPTRRRSNEALTDSHLKETPVESCVIEDKIDFGSHSEIPGGELICMSVRLDRNESKNVNNNDAALCDRSAGSRNSGSNAVATNDSKVSSVDKRYKDARVLPADYLSKQSTICLFNLEGSDEESTCSGRAFGEKRSNSFDVDHHEEYEPNVRGSSALNKAANSAFVDITSRKDANCLWDNATGDCCDPNEQPKLARTSSYSARRKSPSIGCLSKELDSEKENKDDPDNSDPTSCADDRYSLFNDSDDEEEFPAPRKRKRLVKTSQLL